MRAARYHDGGDPDVLQIEEIARPSPSADEILVSIRAASINPADAKRRARGAGPLPKTTGSDFAGIVEEVGKDVTEFDVGDRVCGTGLHVFQQGSFAECAAVPADLAVELPDGISFGEGAAVALVGVTAWRALVDHADTEPSERCLIHGGTGGVGHVAVQLSRIVGGYTVATVSSKQAETFAKDFGANAAVRYDRQDLQDSLLKEVNSGYDVILDHRVHDYLQLDVEVAAPKGQIVHVGGKGSQFRNPRVGRRKELSIHMMNMSNLITNPDLPSLSSILGKLIELVDRGLLTPEISRMYDLDEAAEAHRAVLEDSFIGKLVITP